MQIKQYLKQKKIKISDIAKQCKIPYTTVNEIINGKIDIDRVQIGTGLLIARTCDLRFNDFYNMCKESYALPSIQKGRIVKKNKSYYLQYSLPHESGELYLCKVNPENSFFIKDMAEWTLDTVIKSSDLQKDIKEVEEWTIDSI